MKRSLVELLRSCAGYVWNHIANRLLQQAVGIRAVGCAGSSVWALLNFVPFANESQPQLTCVEYIFKPCFMTCFLYSDDGQ
jgi:hypothetical protein